MDEISKQVPVSQVKVEEGAEELTASENMRPYLNFSMASAAGRDVRPALQAIAALPLQRRYIWRVVSALKWAFVDLDTESLVADIKTLSAEDLAKVHGLVRNRALQFCIFLSALLGPEAAERQIASALEFVKSQDLGLGKN
jgi:hypothetical protein